MARRLALLAGLTVGLVVPACSSTPSFPRYDIDAGIVCDETHACAAGEVCLQGRCYEECSSSLPCGPGERCEEGVCVGFGGDAGMRDAPPPPDVPPDPCDTASCTAPTPYCIAGTCVECATRDDCPPTATICDVSMGTCVVFDAGNVLCAPCNRDLDCAGGLTCETLGAEQVCLPSSSDPCTPGMEASGARCVPVLGQSCRTYRAAIAMRGCSAPTDCVPLGVTPDSGLCPAGVCRFPCGGAVDCPSPYTTCPDGYCAP